MALAHWQRTFTDTAGNVQAGIDVTIRNESTGALAAIYEDSAGTTAKANPFTTDSFGYGDFYAADGRYRIQATGIDWRNEEVLTFENLAAAVTDAEEARDAAAVNGNIYADTTAGLAATVDGEYFSTPAAASDDYLTLYRNDAGSATEIDTYPNSTAIDNVFTELDKRTIYVGSVAELEGLSLDAGVNVYLTESGRAGEGVIKSGSHASDPQKGLFIDLANGNYWERTEIGEEIKASWTGAKFSSTDDTLAIQAAVALSGSLKQVDQDAENPGTTTEPTTRLGYGNSLLTADITNGVFRNTTSIKGEQTHLYDSPLRSVQSAIKLAGDTYVDGVTFRGFVNQIELDTSNIDESTIFFSRNRHINPETAAISFVGNCASTKVVITEFQASLRGVSDSVFIDVGASGTGPDSMTVSNGWITWDILDTAARHECIKGSGIINIDNVIMTPLENVADNTVDAAWVRMERVSDEVHLNGCRLGGEFGGTTAVHCLSEANSSGSGSKSGLYINGGAISSAGKPFVKFWKLPNVINIIGPCQIQDTLGLWLVDSTDADADPTLGGIDFDALQSFAGTGEVSASQPKWLESNQYGMGPNAQLGYSMIWAKYYVSAGLPEKSVIDVSDIAVSGTVIDEDAGTTRINTLENVSGASGTDSRGSEILTITCDGSGSPTNGRFSRYRSSWSNFFESSLIGPSLDSTDDVQFTMLVEVDYKPSKAAAAHLDLQASLQQTTIPLQKGKQTYALPFVYYNTTGVDQSGVDDMAVQVRNLQLNDEVILGRVWIVRGFQKVDLFSLVATKEATGAPADISDAEFGFSGSWGWVKGDRVLVSQPGIGDDTGYICTAAQNATAWSSLGTI